MSAKGQIVFSVNPRPWKRARTRLPTSCGPCRRRKSKCDKGKPCGSCQKSKTADICHYDDSPDSTFESGRSDYSDSVKRHHGMLIASDSTTSSTGDSNGQISPSSALLSMEYHTINSHSETSSSDQIQQPATPLLQGSVLDQANTNMSALSLLALQSEDHLREVASLQDQIQSLKQTIASQNESISELSKKARVSSTNFPMKQRVRNFSGYAVKDSKLTFYGPTAYMSLLLDDKYTAEIFMEYQRKQLKEYDEFSEVQVTDIFNCDLIALSKEPGNSSTETATEATASVTNDLPPLSTVNMLVDRFFQYCYPFAPFIHKAPFLKELDLAIRDNGDHAKLSFESHRYNIIALLLVMLRFAYLTIPFKDYHSGKLSADDMKLVEMFKNSNLTISPNYVMVAYRLTISCLSNLRRVNLPFIQALLLIRIYKMYCPEDDDNMQDTGLIQAVIVQVCRQRGINKNPMGCPEGVLNAEKLYIWKKLWTMVKYTDASYAYNSGGMVLAEVSHNDEPDENEENDIFAKLGFDLSSVIDKPFITRKLCLIDKVTKLMRDVASEMYCKKDVSIEKVISKADALKVILDNDLRSFEQLYNNDSYSMYQGSVAERVEEFLLRCEVTMKVFHLNMVLFEMLDHDEKGEISSVYNKNMFLGSALENFLTMMRISDKHESTQNQMFGAEYVSVSMGVIYRALQKMAGPMFTVVLRALEQVVSINELAPFFRSADSAGLAHWMGIDWQDPSVSLFNLFKRLNLLAARSQAGSKQCLGAHRLHAVLLNGLPFIKNKYPFLREDAAGSSASTFSSVGLGYPSVVDSETMFSDIDELWNRRTWNVDFNYLFAHLNDSGYDPMALQTDFFQQG